MGASAAKALLVWEPIPPGAWGVELADSGDGDDVGAAQPRAGPQPTVAPQP